MINEQEISQHAYPVNFSFFFLQETGFTKLIVQLATFTEGKMSSIIVIIHIND